MNGIEAWHPIESQENPQSTRGVKDSQDFLRAEEYLSDIRAQEQAEREAEENPDDILLWIGEPDESGSEVEPVSGSESDMGHSIDNLPISQQIEAIDAEITELNEKIQTLVANMDSLTDEQWVELGQLQERVSELENQQSQLIEQKRAENEAAIDNYDAALEDFAEIRNFLPDGMDGVSSDLQAILARGDALLNTGEYLGANEEQELSEEIKSITAEAVAYLKQPHHRDELVKITRQMQVQDPQQYEAFKGFLISQDAEFWGIFEDIEANIDDGFEASIAAALPQAPDSGNLHDGFQVDMADGSHINVSTDGNTIHRSLDFEGANFPIETALYEVDVEAVQAERQAILSEVGPKLWNAKFALQLIEQQPNLSPSDMKDELRAALSPDDYALLGIDDLSDPNIMRDHLTNQIDRYEAEIADANQAFQQAAQDAIRRARESYERQDEELKLTLKAIKNSGLGRLGLDWIVRELMAGLLVPDLGAPFDTGNFDPSSNNFGEPLSERDNPTRHLEYIYRIANKVISGDPNEPFSLDPIILRTGNPQPIAPSQSARAALLWKAGLTGGAGMVNKDLVRERLSAPLKWDL